MSKGSATALILIALALAGIAAGGYVAITGAGIFNEVFQGQNPNVTPLVGGPAQPVTYVTLNPVADAETNIDMHNYAKGGDVNVTLRGNGSEQAKIYIKFDLSSIPAGATISSAMLRLNMHFIFGDNQLVEVSNSYTSWSESTITWDNKPFLTGTAVATNAVWLPTGWKGWDVTSSVQAKVNGSEANNGWVIWIPPVSGTSSIFEFDSRESPANKPELVIAYTTAEAAPPPNPQPPVLFTVGDITPTTATQDQTTIFYVTTSTTATSCNFFWGTSSNLLNKGAMNPSSSQTFEVIRWEFPYHIPSTTDAGTWYAQANCSDGTNIVAGAKTAVMVSGSSPGLTASCWGTHRACSTYTSEGSINCNAHNCAWLAGVNLCGTKIPGPSPHDCSAHTDQASCIVAGCTWSTPPPPSAPTVNSINPANGYVGWFVSYTPSITITFSKAMNTSVKFTDITVTSNGTAPAPSHTSWSSANTVLTGSLRVYANTKYTFTLPHAKFTDASGTPMASDYTFYFTTGSCSNNNDCESDKTCNTTTHNCESATPDYSISITPTSATVNQSDSKIYTVSLASIGSFTGSVSLTQNCPAGITCTINLSSVTLTSGGTGSATLTASTTASTAAGTYSTLTITGTSGSITHSATTNLTVRDVTPPASITNLHNTTYAQNSITWAWTEPGDTDFSKVMVYVDNTFKTNVTKGTTQYTATSLSAGTTHTISTHTVDTTGNVNPAWVNSTATTATVPVVTYNLIITKTGTGSGTVNVNGVIVDIYPNTTSYVNGADVEIIAHPDTGSGFGSWTGCDSTGELECTVTMTSAKTVTVNFTDKTPPASITNLQNITYAPDSITWTWTDPLDADFSGVKIFLNGTYKGFVLIHEQKYKATGLNSGTSYVLSTQTGDVNGNLNPILVNSTATTAKGGIGMSCKVLEDCQAGLSCLVLDNIGTCIDVQAPVFVNVTFFPETPYAKRPFTITANVSDNYALRYIDFFIDNQPVWDTCSEAQNQTPPQPNIYNNLTGSCTSIIGMPPVEQINLTVGVHNLSIALSDMQPNVKTFAKTFTVIPVPNVMLSIDPVTQGDENGTTLYYTATITNNQISEHTFFLNITNCPVNWTCSPNSTRIQSIAKDGGTAAVPFSVTSSASAFVLDGYNISTIAYSADNNSINATATFNYSVRSCSRAAPDIDITPNKFKGPAGGEGNFTITVINKDNCIGYFKYSGDCPEDWNCTVPRANSSLLVGANDSLALTIDPAENASEDSYFVNFTVTNLKNTSKAETKKVNYTIIVCTDADLDTYYAEGGDCGAKDCNDNDPTIHPHVQEFCMDSTDRNCNGVAGKNEQGCNKNQSAFDQMLGKSTTPATSKQNTTTAKCGNDIVETGEDCDGNNDAQCTGLCINCVCPFIVGDNVCDTAAGETSALSADCKSKLGGTGIAAVAIGILGALAGGMFYYWRRRGNFGSLAAAHGVETATPGVDLDTAVNSMLSEGYKPEEIHGNLESGGWSHNKISSAMDSAQTDQEALGKLAEQQGVAAPTEKAKVTRYVKKCLELGYDPTQIRTALLSSGWPEDAVDGAISKQTATHIQKHAKKEGVAKPSVKNKEDLGDYVKKELSDGHTKQSIKKVLKDSGWKTADINKAFKE